VRVPSSLFVLDLMFRLSLLISLNDCDASGVLRDGVRPHCDLVLPALLLLLSVSSLSPSLFSGVRTLLMLALSLVRSLGLTGTVTRDFDLDNGFFGDGFFGDGF